MPELSPKELTRVERIAGVMMRVAPLVFLALVVFAYNFLSVGDVVGAVKVNVSGAKFTVEKRFVELHSTGLGVATHVAVVESVRLEENLKTTVDRRVVTLKRGTELKIGVKRIELLLFLAPFSVGLFYAARVVYFASSNFDGAERSRSFEIPSGDLSRTAKAILWSIIFGIAAALYLRISEYFPLRLIYPIVDVSEVAYATSDFKLLMSPTYVALTYVAFSFAVLAAFSVGLLVYSIGRGSKAWINEVRSGRAKL